MSMFSTGLSGLNAAQNALNTTSNNISNVFTPGFNREITQLGEGSAGTSGVQVDGIERQFNQYVATQLNSAKTESSALETYNGQISQIDDLLADRDAGLAPLMQDFFSSIEDLASSPSDPASRQGLKGTADTLGAQFRSFDSYLQDMQSNINGQIEDEVTQVNNITQQIADSNREISLARARNGEAPNSLLNQRDELVSNLNERMDSRLNIQDGKTYQVSLPNGQPLVTGTDSFKLEAVKSDADPQRIVVGYEDGGGNTVELAEDTIQGGSLGGLMSFRAETLDKTQNQIGQLAVSLSMKFNEQHQQGVDLNGEQGKDFFEVRSPEGYGNASNSDSDLLTSVEFDSDKIGQLKATDYTVTVTNNNGGSGPNGKGDFEVVRKDTGEVVKADDVSYDNETLNFGGVKLSFDNANLSEGDSFEIQPVRQAASGMDTAIGDLDKIAAGSFEIEQSKMGNSDKIDVSNVKVSGEGAFANLASPDDPLELELDDNGKLSLGNFSGSTIMVNGEKRDVDGSGVVQDGTGASASAATLSAGDEITIGGISLTLDSVSDSTLKLQEGDASSGDNRNALAMQKLQSEDIVGGSATLSGAYGSMVSDVGNRTNITEVNLEARQGLTDQLEAVQQSESGVNFDEEAANLIQYQQYYQANAKVINTASTVLDTILNLR
ncbi:flagellar hook-associated protein FlgK [Vreelandella jeotgali]|uniref:flagellar hook-associated protein FlgK n=1 Tax=Vreelandella jeotgali TaxID=553386 RepID=UPI00034B9375|nr:flagellar hook-associated protein FlgK [Halomonas jeotgali]